jgi:cytochrome c oxidase assembly protein subunit 15
MRQLLAWFKSGRYLPTYAAFVVGFMVLVIVEGAVVRATGSGNGCGNHWPLCNGEVLPHHPRLATIIEFTHRSLTGACTTLVIALIAWVFYALPRADRARYAVVWTGILLVTEGALGALLVKGGYVEQNASTARVIVQGIHFSNTMLLLAAMAVTWWWLGERTLAPSSPRHSLIAWTALVSTLIVGATGSVAALADTLFPSTTLLTALVQDFAPNAPLLVRMRWLHPASAVIGLACALWLAANVRSRLSRWLLGLIAAQIVLGIADVLLLAPVWMQVLHLLFADLYWITLVAACSPALARLVPDKRPAPRHAAVAA